MVGLTVFMVTVDQILDTVGTVNALMNYVVGWKISPHLVT